ncbi:hypothetical protein [Methylobacterium sp. 22177]|uniref:hypothetical protein n=1 Tax=Methylobacterium sp. 22177 TaxID=3453885 RepID=UPI003F854C06
MNQTPTGGRMVGFIPSSDLRKALERASARNRETISTYIRRTLGEALTTGGLLKPGAPISNLDARRQASGDAL